jgi:hypothetical protein
MTTSGIVACSVLWAIGILWSVWAMRHARRYRAETERLRAKIERDEPLFLEHLRRKAATEKACDGILTQDLERPGVNDAFQRAMQDVRGDYDIGDLR